jgi:hypothetical protein
MSGREGAIIVSDDSETEMAAVRSNQQKFKSTFNRTNLIDRIEIDLTGDDSPPLVTKSRGTPAISTIKKNRKFTEDSSFIDYYYGHSPQASERGKKKRKYGTETVEFNNSPAQSVAPLKSSHPSRQDGSSGASLTLTTLPPSSQLQLLSPLPLPSSTVTTPRLQLPELKLDDERRSSLENLSASQTKKKVVVKKKLVPQLKKATPTPSCPSPKTLEADYSSNSNHSTCSLSTLEPHSSSLLTQVTATANPPLPPPPATTSLPLPLSVSLSSASSSSSSSRGKKDKTMRPLDPEYVLMLAKRDQVLYLFLSASLSFPDLPSRC